MGITRLASRTCPDAKLIQFLFKVLLTGGVAITSVFAKTTVVGVALGRGWGIMTTSMFGFIVFILFLLCETVSGSIVVMHGAW